MELYRFEPLSCCLVWPVMKRLLDTSSPDQPLLITIVLLCTAVLITYNQVCITAFLALLASQNYHVIRLVDLILSKRVVATGLANNSTTLYILFSPGNKV